MRRGSVAILLVVIACGGDKPAPPQPPAELPPVVRRDGEPDRVAYNQILVAFAGAKGARNLERTRVEARRLAHVLVERLKAGEDFVKLMHEYSDDRLPGSARANGPYIACNIGVENRLRADGVAELPRYDLERDIGDALFSMGVGEARLVPYDERTCRWGWHILHRVR